MFFCNFSSIFIKNSKFSLNFYRRFSESNENLVKLFKCLSDVRNKNQLVNFSFNFNKNINPGIFCNNDLGRTSTLSESNDFSKCVGDNSNLPSLNPQFYSQKSDNDICRENKQLIVRSLLNLLSLKTKNYNLVSFLCDSLNVVLNDLSFREVYTLINNILNAELGDSPSDDKIYSLFQTLINRVNCMLTESLSNESGIVKVNELPKYSQVDEKTKINPGLGIDLDSSIHLEKLWQLWYKLSTSSSLRSEYRYTISLLLSVLEQQSGVIFQYDLGRVTRTLDTLVGESMMFSKLDERTILKLFKRFSYILSDVSDEQDCNLYIKKNNITPIQVKKVLCNLSKLSKTSPKFVFDIMKLDKFYLSLENFLKISRVVFKNEFSKIGFSNLAVGSNQQDFTFNNNNGNTNNAGKENNDHSKDEKNVKEFSMKDEFKDNRMLLDYVDKNLERVRLDCSKLYLKLLSYTVDILKIVDYMRLEDNKLDLSKCNIGNIGNLGNVVDIGNIGDKTSTVNRINAINKVNVINRVNRVDKVDEYDSIRRQLIGFSQELISNIYLEKEELMLSEARSMYYLLLSSYLTNSSSGLDNVDGLLVLEKVAKRLESNYSKCFQCKNTKYSKSRDSNSSSTDKTSTTTLGIDVDKNNNKDDKDIDNKWSIKSVQYLLYCDKISSLLKELKISSESVIKVELICKRIASELCSDYNRLLSVEGKYGLMTLYVTLMNKYNLLTFEIYYKFLNSIGNWNEWKVHEISMLCDLFSRTYPSLVNSLTNDSFTNSSNNSLLSLLDSSTTITASNDFIDTSLSNEISNCFTHNSDNRSKELLCLVVNALDSLVEYFLLGGKSHLFGNKELISLLTCLDFYKQYIRENESKEVKENNNTNKTNKWEEVEQVIRDEIRSRIDDMNFKQLVKVLKLNNIIDNNVKENNNTKFSINSSNSSSTDKTSTTTQSNTNNKDNNELVNDIIRRIFELKHLGDITCVVDVLHIRTCDLSSNKHLVSRILSEYDVEIVDERYLLFEKLLKFKYFNKFSRIDNKSTYLTQQTYDILSK